MERTLVLCINKSASSKNPENRVIEVGVIELVDRELTGNNFHAYLNPPVDVELEAIEKHGITNEFLADKPTFSEVSKLLANYIGEALVIVFGSEVVQQVNNEFDEFQIREFEDYKVKLSAEAPDVEPSIVSYCSYFGINIGADFGSALLDAERLTDLYAFIDAIQGFEFIPTTYEYQGYSDFDNFVEQKGQYALYRGVSNEDYDLVPSLFRERKSNTNVDVVESKLIDLFKKQAMHQLEIQPTSFLQWLVVAQHHGLPTRLLDWSLNPLIAAFFAAHDTPEKDGIIYGYEPGSFQIEEEISISGLASIAAFYPSHTSKRVTAQSGMFTIHPTVSTKLVSKKRRFSG